MTEPQNQKRRWRRVAGFTFLGIGLLVLASMLVLLRLTVVTDYMYSALVKDPERHAPSGPVIVSPADGTVLYVTRVENGVIPEVVKKGVPVPMVDHIKDQPLRPFESGYLIGIYMNTFGVHINRIPAGGTVVRQTIFNGPHMDMTDAEVKIILKGMVPGLVTARKLLGLSPHGTENDHDFVLKSARETLTIEDERGTYMYMVRIADYYVGKILTWVHEGERVETGQRMGMITWGSQTDLFIEDSSGLEVTAKVGEYVYAGETVLATY